MELIAEPTVVHRPEQPTLGIRIVTPFRGMLAVRDKLWEELFGWLVERGIARTLPPFLRLNVVDMAGQMDIEAGVVTPRRIEGDSRVTAGSFPSGNYATLTYRDHSVRANRLLIDWSREHEVDFDSETVPAGDRFACRYELIQSDLHKETRKTRWTVELNFLTRTATGR